MLMGKGDLSELARRDPELAKKLIREAKPRKPKEETSAVSLSGKDGRKAGEEKNPSFAAKLQNDYEAGGAQKGDEARARDHDDDDRDDIPELDPLWEEPSDQCADTEKHKERQDTCPIDALSKTVSDPVGDWMRHLRIPALLPVICALVAISVALGRGLKALSNKTWTFPNIFALMGAETGSGKSLVYDEAMRPLVELQADIEEAFEKEKGRILAKIGMRKAEISAKHSILQKGVREKKLTDDQKQAIEDSLSELHQQVEDLEDRLSKPPCVWTSDFTSEALGVCLKNNDERIAVLSDEGSMALYNILGRYNDGNVTDDALLCKCYSVNSHGVDRLSRGRITLKEPCVTMGLIVQPDILRMAFSNTRLLIGGFLARCFSADTHLQMREETEQSAVHFDSEIADEWNKFIKDLYAKFHEALEPYKLTVDPGVRVKSRIFYNKIVRLVRGRLNDIRGFAARWNEQAWKIAQILHAGIHGTECEEHSLSTETFENATRIVRYFIATQLEVLQAMRIDMVEKTHAKLQELFVRYQNAPIRMRDLEKRHGLHRGLVLSCVKTYPKIYGTEIVKSARGGEPSIVIFLRKFKPTNFEA
jgi:hypothetical protein